MMRQNAADQRERWLTLLAKWETRLHVQGDDWTWRYFEDTSVARAALDAENMPTKPLKARAKRLLKQDEASRSALIREIEKGDPVGLSDRIRALVAAGADLDGASLLKDVPLAFARDRGIASIFDLLLELGADPAKVEFDALHQAVRFGDLDDVRAVLEGSDPLARRPDADSPLWLAVTRGDPGIVAALLDALAARGQMADAAVDVSLGLAAQEGRADLVALFLERGADPNATLDDLTYRLDTDILALYIKHGADVSKLNDLTLYHQDVLNLRDAQGAPKITAFVDMLLAAGWQVDDLDEFEREQIRFVTKAHLIAPQDRHAPGFADTAEATEGSCNQIA